MCILCGLRSRTSGFTGEDVGHWPHAVGGRLDDPTNTPIESDPLPTPSYGNGPLNDYTPPGPLPTFTYDQIVRALRTSGIMEAAATTTANDHVTDQRTWSWGTAGDIVYEVDAGTMSTLERSRIELAFEVWDDLINVDIRNDQSAGDAGGPTRFTTVRYVATGADAGRAFYSIDTAAANSNTNGYGTTDNTINTGTFSLGRSFNGGEFDGRNAFGNLDSGAHDLTLFARRGFETLLHEAGHGLGLSHPGYYNNGHVTIPAGVRFDQDNRRNTIMSYRDEAAGADSAANWNGLFAATPMIYDIAAVQTTYGADPNTRTGATSYGFNNNSGRPVFDFSTTLGSVFAIYDAGGIDTMDASGFTSASVINLWPGTFSSIGQAAGNTGLRMIENIGIAFNTTIENARGGTGADTISGNNAGNHLFGDAGVDTLVGLGGNDTLDPWHDGGTMYGGDDQDVLWSGNGGDYMDGGDGYDRAVFARSPSAITIDTTIGKVFGGDAQGDTLVNIETIVATAHDDRVRMGGGDNAVWGGNGQDDLDGGSGGDRLFGEGGDDLLVGGDGRWLGDLYYVGDEINGGDGVDTAAFGKAVTVDLRPGGVHGGEAWNDTFVSIERFRGSAEIDVFYGDGFNNWFQGRGEGDYMNGGGGEDTASYADRSSGITADMTFVNLEPGDEARHPNAIAGRTDGKISPAEGTWIDTLISIENIEGTNHGDVFLGDERNNTFWGLAGADRFEGDSGATPQGSWDDMFGGGGDDSFVVGPNDYADGGAGSDSATFVGGPLFLNFTGFDFRIGSTPIHVQNIETYVGTELGDTVYGAAHGEAISLGAGNDSLYGQDGNDFLYTGAGGDVMHGGAGYDTIVFHKAMVADWQAGVLDTDIASDPWYEWEAIQGSAGADRIRTNSWGFAVELRGGAGNDVLATGAAGVARDRLSGEDGHDYMDGGAGADTVSGGLGNDTARGGVGNDLLVGGEGNDALLGGAGRDALQGGAGRDRFDFNQTTESPVGASCDALRSGGGGAAFDGAGAAVGDRIDLLDIDADITAGSNQAFVFGGSGKGRVWCVNSGDVTQVLANVDNDAAAEFQLNIHDFGVLANAYTAADFVL